MPSIGIRPIPTKNKMSTPLHRVFSADSTASRPAPRPWEVGLTVLGFGLAAGPIELFLVVIQRAVVTRISMASLRTNQHFFWMIPVADALIYGLFGLILAALARSRPRLARRLAYSTGVGLLGLTVLLTVEGIYPLARGILALGLACWAGPIVESAAPRLRRTARWALPVLGGGLVALVAAGMLSVFTAERRALAGRPAAKPGAPNVLLVVLDNVRAASMSLYGNDRPTTPNLERLAREAVRFEEARSPSSWTLPSHSSMFTGRWPHELSVSWDHALDDRYPTLAEYLGTHGYATAGFVGNTYYGNRRYGLNRGFARYDDYYENQTVSLLEILRSAGVGRLLLPLAGFPVQVGQGEIYERKTAAKINRDVLDWLDTRPADRPFFAFVNFFDAHAPCVLPPGATVRFGHTSRPDPERVEVLKKFQQINTQAFVGSAAEASQVEREAINILRDAYESCIASIDQQLARLFQELQQRGLRDNTLVIVASDHGEHFKEHGFLGHGQSLYRREVHVPLLIFPPGGQGAGRTVAEPVSLRDLPATVVDLLGIEAGSPFPGHSLAAHWRAAPGSAPPQTSAVLSEVGHREHYPKMSAIPTTLGTVDALVAEGKVYILNGTGRDELYDLKCDPLEATNLADDPVYRDFLPRFRSYLEQARAGDGGPKRPRGLTLAPTARNDSARTGVHR